MASTSYPFHDATFTVTYCGRLCFKGRKVHLSHVFAGQNVGVTQVGERIWLVTFVHYDLGYFDDETCRLEPIGAPIGGAAAGVLLPLAGRGDGYPKKIGFARCGGEARSLDPRRPLCHPPGCCRARARW